jgi:hypothetical protein
VDFWIWECHDGDEAAVCSRVNSVACGLLDLYSNVGYDRYDVSMHFGHWMYRMSVILKFYN